MFRDKKLKINFLQKTAALLLVLMIFMPCSQLIPLPARAFSGENKTFAGNGFSTGTLSAQTNSAVFTPGPLYLGDSTTTAVTLSNTGTLPFQFVVKSQNLSGDQDLCAALKIGAAVGPVSSPATSLSLFENSGVTPVSGSTSFTFNVNLPATAAVSLQNKTCNFQLAIHSWQTLLPNYNVGFSDTKTLNITIHTGQFLVINELMWMGSRGKPNDKWLELRNQTGTAVDLSNFNITKLTGSGQQLMLSVPAGKTIPGHGFFLISYYDESNSNFKVTPDLVDTNVDLSSSNLQVKLYDGNWTVASSTLLDIAGDGNSPLAGFQGPLGYYHFSMERNDIARDGSLASSWHSCWDDSSEMRGLWNPSALPILGSANRGTPQHRNLSDYDEQALRKQYTLLEQQASQDGFLAPQINIPQKQSSTSPDSLDVGGGSIDASSTLDSQTTKGAVGASDDNNVQPPAPTTTPDNSLTHKIDSSTSITQDGDLGSQAKPSAPGPGNLSSPEQPPAPASDDNTAIVSPPASPESPKQPDNLKSNTGGSADASVNGTITGSGAPPEDSSPAAPPPAAPPAESNQGGSGE